MERGFLNTLLRSSKTVFSFKDLVLMWGGIDRLTAGSRVHYYVQKGHLYPVRRGLYAKDKNYDRFELATKIFTPCYISFETVLGRAGVTFQFYGKIFIASYQSREITCDGQVYHFRKIKDAILTNDAGMENRENYFIASAERAFLDVLYLFKDYHFDNVSPLNWDRVWEIFPIYGGNKRMEKKINEFGRHHTQEHSD
ncbi:MAG: type IV toxin-antitoxin system AbiEi family antitoxin domain-containing protein [Chlamydiae bacterium]|nr:type IV toxin-antitoxin system AbiEi family antitoxin domain-containing protein [Chlamydiota bacterium]